MTQASSLGAFIASHRGPLSVSAPASLALSPASLSPASLSPASPPPPPPPLASSGRGQLAKSSHVTAVSHPRDPQDAATTRRSKWNHETALLHDTLAQVRARTPAATTSK